MSNEIPMPAEPDDVIMLEDGKYAVFSSAGRITAARLGESWRDLTGDKLVGALVDEVLRLRALLAADAESLR